MADTDLDSIVKRLDRIEQAVSHLGGIGGIGGAGNPVVDPPPDDLVRLRPDIFQRRLIDLLRDIIIKGDPPPFDITRFRVDDLANLRLRDLLHRIPGGFGGVVDPAPDDIGRLTKAEVEVQIHRVNAEMVRLRSLEKMLNERLANFKE
jgi:hypothetical protein